MIVSNAVPEIVQAEKLKIINFFYFLVDPILQYFFQKKIDDLLWNKGNCFEFGQIVMEFTNNDKNLVLQPDAT